MSQPHLSGADRPGAPLLTERLRMARAVESAWCAAWASLGAGNDTLYVGGADGYLYAIDAS